MRKRSKYDPRRFRVELRNPDELRKLKLMDLDNDALVAVGDNITDKSIIALSGVNRRLRNLNKEKARMFKFGKRNVAGDPVYMRNSGIDALSRSFDNSLNISRLLPNDDIIRLTSANKMFRMFGAGEIRDRALGGGKYARREKDFDDTILLNNPTWRFLHGNYASDSRDVDHVGNPIPPSMGTPPLKWSKELAQYKPKAAVIPPWRRGIANSNVLTIYDPNNIDNDYSDYNSFRGFVIDDTAYRYAKRLNPAPPLMVD